MGALEEYKARNAERDARRAEKERPPEKRVWWFSQPVPIDRFTGWLVAWTALLFVATIGNAIILNHTDDKIGRQAEISAEQLRVMQGQLDAMEADQRPWVFASGVSISRPVARDDKGTNIQLLFNLKNGGKSPAMQTSVRFRAYLGTVNYRQEEQIVCKDAQPQGLGLTLFPDAPAAPQETGWLIPTQEIFAAKQSGATINPFIVACVSYQLPRTKEYRTTPYEFILSPALGSTKWPCCNFPIDEKEIAPTDLQLILIPVTPPS